MANAEGGSEIFVWPYASFMLGCYCSRGDNTPMNGLSERDGLSVVASPRSDFG